MYAYQKYLYIIQPNFLIVDALIKHLQLKNLYIILIKEIERIIIKSTIAFGSIKHSSSFNAGCIAILIDHSNTNLNINNP